MIQGRYAKDFLYEPLSQRLQTDQKTGLGYSTAGGIYRHAGYKPATSAESPTSQIIRKVQACLGRACRAPDWILIYELDNNHLILRRTGTHADLF